MSRADPALIEGWLRARSLARGLPPPVADSGGWRVDTDMPAELRRYVFAAPCDELRDLARGITTSRVFLKLCADEPTMRGLLPAAWRTEPGTWMMTCDRWTDVVPSVPAGYRTEIEREGPVITARILGDDGSIAASGYAAECDGVFAYDRIVTAEAHRRLGLGAAIMTALASARLSDARQMLAATEAGRALYTSLGWTVHSDYTTAFISEA